MTKDRGFRWDGTLLGREFTIWSSGAEEIDDIRIHCRFGELRAQVQCGISRASDYATFSVSIEPDGDEPLHIGGGIGRPHLYLLLESQALRKLASQLAALFPDPSAPKYETRRDTGLTIGWDRQPSISWRLHVDRNGWSSDRPKWRDGSWYPLGHHQRQGDLSPLEVAPVEIKMPERVYKGIARRSRGRMGITGLPRFLDRDFSTVEIEMLEGEQVPFPGKGENSWDCGEDATYSSSGPYKTIAEAVRSFEESTLKRRLRHGGPGWRPEARVGAVAAS